MTKEELIERLKLRPTFAGTNWETKLEAGTDYLSTDFSINKLRCQGLAWNTYASNARLRITFTDTCELDPCYYYFSNQERAKTTDKTIDSIDKMLARVEKSISNPCNRKKYFGSKVSNEVSSALTSLGVDAVSNGRQLHITLKTGTKLIIDSSMHKSSREMKALRDFLDIYEVVIKEPIT